MTDWLDVSDDTPRVAYTATAAQTVFAVPFVFFDESDLQVYVDDVLKTLSTDYVTSGAGEEAGGSVTFNSGLVGSESVVITRVLALELTTHVPPSGPLDVAGLNLQFSRFVAMLQQVDDNRARSVRQPDSDAEAMDDLPAAASRASKYLFFDADGNPTVVASVSSSAAVAAFWVTVLQTASAATARTALGISDTASAIGTFQHLNFR